VILSSSFILGVDVDDAVGVNVESDFDLRDSSRSGGNAREVELTQELVIGNHLSLSLEDSDGDGGLVVSSSRVDLGFLGRDGGVSGDHLGHDTSEGLDAERKGSDVQKQEVLHVSLENTALDSGTNCNCLVGVDGFVGSLFEDFLDELDDFGHTGHTSDQDDFFDLVLGEVRILDAVLAGLDCSLEEVVSQGFELSSGEFEDEVFGARSISGQEGKVDFGLGGLGELDLGLLGGFSKPLDGSLVLGHINAGLLLELLEKKSLDNAVNVLTSAGCISVSGLDLKDTLHVLEDRDIECSSSQIVDSDDFILLFLHTVGQSSSSWLVDYSFDLETSDFAGILGGLTL
jgi:hypothetical protein